MLELEAFFTGLLVAAAVAIGSFAAYVACKLYKGKY